MGPGSSDTKATDGRVARWADLLELSYEPMLVWRLDGPIEFWNAGAERLYGYAADEAIGRNSHALLQTRFPVDFTEVRSRLRNEGYWSGELRHVRKDGRDVMADSRMQMLADDTVLEVNRNVTEVKALITRQAALLRAQSDIAAKYEAVFNQASIFAGIMDLQGYLREANDASLRSCGYTRDQVLDLPFWDTPWWRGRNRRRRESAWRRSRPRPESSSARSCDIGPPMAASASWTFRCTPFATGRAPSRSCIPPASTSPSASGSKRSCATASGD